MANIDNNKNTEQNKPLTGKVDEAVDQLKKAVTHPLDTVENLAEQATKDVVSYTWWARLLLILFYSGLALVILFFVVINLPVTKRYVASQAIKILNSDFKAEMSTQSVDVNIFGDVIVRGLIIKDHKGNDFLKARQFRANSDWFSIIKNSSDIKFDALSLVNADLKVVTYKGDSVDNFNIYIKKFQSDKKKKEGVFRMKTRVVLVDSKVSIINQNKPGEEGKWLMATQLNARIPRLNVYGSSVNARINNISFNTTRWGKTHFVETFSTDLVFNDKLLTFKDLTINTDRSLFQGDVIVRQDRRTGWADFENKVRLSLSLKRGSQLSGYDISYFLPEWDKYEPINVSGRMTGVLNRFYLENFVLSTKNVQAQTKVMRLEDLLKGRFHVEAGQLSTDFTYPALKAALPTFISRKMGNLADVFGRIKYNGALRATPGEIFARGNLVTSIGQANANVTLVGYSGNQPRYRGNAIVKDFNVAAITKRNEVGLVTGKVEFVGQGFDVNTLRIQTKANIQRIDIMQRDINNLYVDGILDRRRFNGLINVKDEHAQGNVKGIIDFSSPRLFADVVADIQHLNLDYFGLKGQGNFSGQLDGKIAMTNLNDLTLDARIAGLKFGSGTSIFTIPNAEVKAFMQNGQRIVSVNAPGAINGQIAGRFNLGDLGGMIQNGLNKILVGQTPRRMYRGQSFTMNFDLSQDAVNYFMPALKIPKGAKVDGSYTGNSNDLILNVDVPELLYVMTKQIEITEADRALALANPAYKITENRTKRDSATARNLVVRINTANYNEQIYAKVDRAEFNKNVFRDISLTGRNENNQVMHISANFLHGTPDQEENDKLKAYAINLNQSVDANRDIVIRFDPTEIKFNDVVWAVDTSPALRHSITYRKKTKDFVFSNLRVYSGSSAVLVNGSYRNAKDFDIDADVQQVDISKVMALVSTENSMDIEGLADGSVKIRMKNNNLEPIIDLNVNGIKMNGQDMGNMVINAKNSGEPNIYDVDARIVSAGIIGNNNLVLRGTINNNTSSPTLNLVADLNEFDVKFAQEFVKGIFSNMRGKATGLLNINGTLSDLDYNGDIALKGFGLKLNFSGVDYSFEDTVIPLSRGYAVLNNIGIKDGRNNSSGSISGALQFETIASMGVNLIIRADNLMLLNSTQKDFDVFWGRVYGQGDIFIDGPVSALNISADARVLNNSIFTLNSNTTSTVEEFRMLRFLKEDTEGIVSIDERKITGPNMNVDLNLDVDRGTTVNVLVGDDIGDISVRGEATDLKFSMNRTGSMFINGSYFVDTGTFSSKAVLNRTFQIEKGSNIAWDGDALNPMLDITANYYRMVSNAGDYLDIGKIQPINILLQIGITGTLKAPQIAFDVKAPDVSSQIRETLAYKMSTEDEKVLQFGSVLVMNSFNVASSGGLDFSLDNTIRSTGYSMLFKQLGSVLNSISNEFQIDLNYIQGDQGSNTGDRANAGVNITLSPRVTLKTGLGIPVSRRENTTDDYVSTEGILEYDWSKKNDGSRLFRVYSKPTNIGMAIGSNAGSDQTYGAGVVYSKSFNTIFKRKKKTKSAEIENIETKQDSVRNDTIKK